MIAKTSDTKAFFMSVLYSTGIQEVISQLH